MEQEEYTKEEINWSYVEFVDNQDVLDLIEKVPTHKEHCMSNLHNLYLLYGTWNIDYISLQKPGGIIALLDEAWYAFFLHANEYLYLETDENHLLMSYEVIKQVLNLAPMAHATLGKRRHYLLLTPKIEELIKHWKTKKIRDRDNASILKTRIQTSSLLLQYVSQGNPWDICTKDVSDI